MVEGNQTTSTYRAAVPGYKQQWHSTTLHQTTCKHKKRFSVSKNNNKKKFAVEYIV